MRRIQKHLAIVSLFFFQLLSVASLAKSDFVDVPESCVRELAKLASDSEPGAIKSHVSWSNVRKNMLGLGYPDRIVTQKLESISWHPEQALAHIRAYAQRPDWNWGDPFTGPMLQALAASPIVSAIYSSLPFWDSLEGFDTPLVIHTALSSAGVDQDGLKALTQFAPLWLRGELALENAKMFLGQFTPIDRLGPAPWILANLAPADREKIAGQLLKEVEEIQLSDEAPSNSADSALRLMATLPLQKIPASLLKHLLENWVDLETYPAEKMDSIHYVGYGVQYAGCCQYMMNGHLTTLGLARAAEPAGQANWKESVLIRVGGKLVGSLKLTGDPSMIALRNVTDSEGRTILALGGVYHVEKDVYERIRGMAKEGDHWRVVDLDELRVYPWTFLLNQNAWSDLNNGMLFSLGSLDANSVNGASARTKHNAVWKGLLAALTRFRLEFEQGGQK